VFAITPDQPANPDLKWESSYQTKPRIGIGLLKIESICFDLYIDTKDLILETMEFPNTLVLQMMKFFQT
jgi:hypothetical protein